MYQFLFYYQILGTGFEKEKQGKDIKDIICVDLIKKSTNNFNKKYKQYEKDLNNFASKPYIRCSSPYSNEEERKRREFLETKNKWSSNIDFKKVFGKNSTNLKMLPSGIGGSSSPKSSHQFRDIDRSKWVNNKNFKL